MSFQMIFRLFRKAIPAAYATSQVFVDPSMKTKPDASEKLQVETPNAKKLSYDHMIKQSTINAVNSASETLTVTYMAIETASNEYRALLSRLISLLQETMAHDVSDLHWDKIVEVQSEVRHKKQIITQLVGYKDYVHKMAVAASEISFLSGMDNLSSTLCQRIDDALNNINKEVTGNQALEKEYLLVEKECIVKTKAKKILEEMGETVPTPEGTTSD